MDLDRQLPGVCLPQAHLDPLVKRVVMDLLGKMALQDLPASQVHQSEVLLKEHFAHFDDIREAVWSHFMFFFSETLQLKH